LAQVALTNRFKQDLLIDAAGGARPNVSGKNIEKITIPLPPPSRTKKIADLLTSIDYEIEKELDHKEQLETLKKRFNAGIINWKNTCSSVIVRAIQLRS